MDSDVEVKRTLKTYVQNKNMRVVHEAKIKSRERIYFEYNYK